MNASKLLKELSVVGVRELRFINEDTAVDQYGRIIKFQRVVDNGELRTIFKFV